MKDQSTCVNVVLYNLANHAIKKNVKKKAQNSVHKIGSVSKSKTLEI